MTTTANQPIAALQALHCCHSGLHEIRLDALTAATALSGVRAERARELADKLADALTHCQRLAFIVEGDICADAAGQPTVGDLQDAARLMPVANVMARTDMRDSRLLTSGFSHRQPPGE